MRRANPLTIIRRYHTDERRLLKALMLVLAKRPPDTSPQASRAVSCPETTQPPPVPPAAAPDQRLETPKAPEVLPPGAHDVDHEQTTTGTVTSSTTTKQGVHNDTTFALECDPSRTADDR